MKFPYARIDKSHPLIPVIPLDFFRGDKTIGAWGLVDSGTTRSLFDVQFATCLGIDLEAGRKELFEAVAGEEFVGYVHTVTVKLGGHRYSDVSVGFAPNISTCNFGGMLGQEDFFSLFRIKFTYSKKEVELVPERRR